MQDGGLMSELAMLSQNLDLPFLLSCSYFSSESPPDLVGDVDLHIELFCKCPDQTGVLLEHPSYNS